MQELRLIERYTKTRFEAPKSEEVSAAQIEKREPSYQMSIKGHLWRLLNTRKGSVLIDAAYGVPDFSIGAQQLDLEAVEKELYAVISQYEPRLNHLRLRIVTSERSEEINCVIFITGTVTVNQDVLPVELKGLLLPDGTFEFE